MDRRDFVRRCTLTLGALWAGRLAACSDDPAARKPDTTGATDTGATDTGTPDATDAADAADAADTLDWATRGGLPSLGGAPDTAEGRAIAAFCDVVYPSAHRDPTGAPGALEAMAPGVFFDPRLPAAALVPLMALLLDGVAAEIEVDKTLYDLTPDQRDAAVELARSRLPEIDFAIQLAKVAALSAGPVGLHLGYPGPNEGYAADPDMSFGRAMATPHATTVSGNLP